MARSRSRHSEDPTSLLNAIEEGEQGALAKLLAWSCDDVRQYVQNRLDRRLVARFDAADVLQEVQISVTQRIGDYLRRRPMPYRLWLRQTAIERLADLRRHHLRQRRSPQVEEALPDKTSLALIRSLVDTKNNPSSALAATELAREIKQALSELPDGDREILLMRQLENTPFSEIAVILEIEPSAARKRFARALGKLEAVLRGRGLVE